MTTKIEWCDETWNPITGCTPISEGCKNCYADRMAKRLAGRFGYPQDDPFQPNVFHPDKIDINMFTPGKRIFAGSMCDLFHEKVNIRGNRILEVFRCMSHHDNTFCLLTKRPERMKACIDYLCESDDFLDHYQHLWLGVSAENQERADERIPILLNTPAAIRFVSVEPMLGPVNIYKYFECESCIDPLVCWCNDPRLKWVICGPETGTGKRPFNYDWARDLRDQCQAAEIPFFFKKHDHPDTPEDLRIAEFPK